VVAIAATTIAYPALQRLTVVEAAPVAAGPPVSEVLGAPAPEPTVPEALAVTLDQVAIERRGVELVSRSLVTRDPAPTCSGVVTSPGRNGRLPASVLCDLWQAPYQDRADAVVTLFALNDDFRAAFGRDLCLTSGYRTLEQQAALRAKKGGLAAPPGTSNHGWGLAIDICESDYTGERGRWLDEVGPVYGWANPPWAHRGGAGPYEPWHWEFTDAVAALESGTGE